MCFCVSRTFVQAYGGYLATMLLSSEEFNQLKCGTAVSPITDFELYGITFHIFFFYGCVKDVMFLGQCLKGLNLSNLVFPLF